MRLILIASYSDLVSIEDADLLNLRGYNAITFAHLHEPAYTLNKGCVPTAVMAWQNLAVEILENGLPVLHPECPPELAARVAALCRALHAPLVHLEALPACPPVSTEVIDSINVAASIALIVLPTEATAPDEFYTPLRERLRLAGTWIADALVRFEHWFNREWGWFLTNGRKAAERTEHQPTPRPYRLNTMKPTVTQ